MSTSVNYYIASAYGSGAYGSCTYENGTCQVTGGGISGTGSSGGNSSGGGLLTNTGFDLVLAATLACAIVFVSLLVRFWKKPAEVQVESDDRNRNLPSQ